MMKRYFGLLQGFIFFLALSLSSCGFTRKIVIREMTVTKIDTIIKVSYDTVPIIREVPVYDTVTIENKVAVARSYINPVTGKLVLSLTGKVFDVPVRAEVINMREKTEPVKKNNWKQILLLVGISLSCIIIGYLIAKR